MPFSPGPLSQPEASSLNRLEQLVTGHEALSAVPPLVVVPGQYGRKTIMMGGDQAALVVRGKLDAALTPGNNSATLSVWAWDGSVDADTGDDVTVYGHLLPPTVKAPSGVMCEAAWDARSGRYLLRPFRWKVVTVLGATLNQGSSATSTVADTGETLTVYDCLLSTGQTVASGKTVTAFYDPADNNWKADGAQCA